jgi:hypothetical protein
VNVPGLVVVGLVALGLGVVAANAVPLVTAAPMTPPATIELATAPAARSIRNLFIRFHLLLVLAPDSWPELLDVMLGPPPERAL